MKPFTITIASPAALELIQQFADTLPNGVEVWAEDLKDAANMLKTDHPRLEEVTQHRHLIGRLAKKTKASIELGVDVVLDDNEGFLADYIDASKAISKDFSAASVAKAKQDIMKSMGCSERGFAELAERALEDADCPDDVKQMLRESLGTTTDTDISDGILDDLANEGKNVVKFPTGRKDN